MPDHMADVKRFHSDQIEPLLGSPVGAEITAVLALEAELGGRVPAAYREYLLWMGCDKNGAFQGTDCFIDDVAANNEWLPKLLEENDVEFELPARYVVFFMHQGYEAAWFDLDSVEADPACWAFSEGSTDEPEPAGSFTEFLMQQLEGLLPAIKTVVASERKQKGS